MCVCVWLWLCDCVTVWEVALHINTACLGISPKAGGPSHLSPSEMSENGAIQTPRAISH